MNIVIRNHRIYLKNEQNQDLNDLVKKLIVDISVDDFRHTHLIYMLEDIKIEQFKVFRPKFLKFLKDVKNIDMCQGDSSDYIILDSLIGPSDNILSFCGFLGHFRTNQTNLISDIIRKYTGQFSKKAVLKLQKDLIDAGFAENALW